MGKRFVVTASDEYENRNTELAEFSGLNYLPLSRLLLGLKGKVIVVVRRVTDNTIVNEYIVYTRDI